MARAAAVTGSERRGRAGGGAGGSSLWMERIRETSPSERPSDGACFRRPRAKRGQTEKVWTWPEEVGSGWQEAWRMLRGFDGGR